MITVALTAALIAALPGSALAADGEVTDVPVRDNVTDRPTDEVIDLPHTLSIHSSRASGMVLTTPLGRSTTPWSMILHRSRLAS